MKDLKKKFREDVTFRRTSAIVGLIVLVAVLFVGIHLRRAVVYERMIQDVCDGAYIVLRNKKYQNCRRIIRSADRSSHILRFEKRIQHIQARSAQKS